MYATTYMKKYTTDAEVHTKIWGMIHKCIAGYGLEESSKITKLQRVQKGGQKDHKDAFGQHLKAN